MNLPFTKQKRVKNSENVTVTKMVLNFLYFSASLLNLPMVEEVMDARRPNTQENGREMAMAPVPIFPTCKNNQVLIENLWGEMQQDKM